MRMLGTRAIIDRGDVRTGERVYPPAHQTVTRGEVMSRIVGAALALLAAAVVATSASGGSPPLRGGPPPLPDVGGFNFVTMFSDRGDWIGGGGMRFFVSGRDSVTVSGSAGYVSLSVSGGPFGDHQTLLVAAPPGQT